MYKALFGLFTMLTPLNAWVPVYSQNNQNYINEIDSEKFTSLRSSNEPAENAMYSKEFSSKWPDKEYYYRQYFGEVATTFPSTVELLFESFENVASSLESSSEEPHIAYHYEPYKAYYNHPYLESSFESGENVKPFGEVITHEV